MLKKLLLIIVSSLSFCAIHAQVADIEAYSESWSVNEGLHSSTILHLHLDSIGKVFLSYENGDQKFDGSRFGNLYSIDNNSISPVSFIGRDNFVYRFHENKITKTSNDIYESVVLEKTIGSNKNEFVQGINTILHESRTHIWFMYGAYNLILLEKENLTIKGKIHLKEKIDLIGKSSSQADSVLVVQNNKFKWLTYDNKNIVLSQSVLALSNVKSFITISPDRIIALNDNLIVQSSLTGHNDEVIQKLPITKNSFRSYISKYAEDEYLISADNSLYLVNIKTKQVKRIITRNTKSNFFKSSMITSISVDCYKNIWLKSLAEGLVKVALTSDKIKLYGKREGNFIISLFFDEEKNILITGSLNGGITIYDSLANIVYKGSKPRFNSPIMIWKNRSDEYCYGSLLTNKIYRLKNVKGKFEETFFGEIPEVFNYYAFQYNNSADFIGIVCGNNHCIEIQKNTNKLKIRTSKAFNKNNAVLYAALKVDENYYMGSNKMLLEYDQDFELKNQITLPGITNIRAIARLSKQKLLLGSRGGLHEFDLIKKRFKQLAKGSVFSISGNEIDGFWCGTDRGLLHLQNGKIVQFSTNDGLSCQEYNGNCSYHFGKNNFIFGGIGGVDMFNQMNLKKRENDQKCILSDILINGQNDFRPYMKNKTIVLPHDEANISFSLAILGFGTTKNHSTHYVLEGMDKQWNNGAWNSTINYHLTPGKYQFKYSAIENPPIGSYDTVHIEVLSPIYKRWWFLLIAGIAVIALVSYIINLINRVKFEKQKSILVLKEKLNAQRSEFSKELHDVIGSQLGVVSRNIDHVKEELESLPIDKSKQILNSTYDISIQMSKDLRDTVWVSNTKEITIEVFVVRLKDHIYMYQDGKITIEVIESYDNKILEPIEAFNLFRIIMEAVNNAVKHSGGDKIVIEISNDEITITDNGKGQHPQDGIGFGLSNMQLRADRIGYTFKINFSSLGTKAEVKKN
jgi:signal transduction histidine kinase